MNVIGRLLDHLIGKRVLMRSVHALEARSGNDVEQVANDGVDHEHFTVLVVVPAPRIGRPMRNDFEFFEDGMIPPNSAVDFLSLADA